MLYFGAFSLNAVVSWDPSTPLTPANQMTVASNASTMQWQDTFAFDNSGNLFFTTNRLQLFFTVRLTCVLLLSSIHIVMRKRTFELQIVGDFMLIVVYYMQYTMDFTGASGSNFRVFKV